MKQMFTPLLLAAALLGSESLLAQDRGFGRGGDRGGDRGSRSGDAGGRGGLSGGGMPGGFGGGAPGGFGGGPPGGFGGFGGGPPGGFGGFGGGPPGGGFGGFGGGPPGGGDSDRGSRFTSMMDSNGNGKIDQEELDRVPSFVRDMIKARGIELKPGMSLDDMRNSVRSGFSGGPPGSPENPGQPQDNNKPKGMTPYRMKTKKPMILELPPAYAEVDTDFDGQLGMHEWIMTRRADLEQFETMDLDFDGFLTPEELQAAELAAAAGQKVASTKERKRLTIVTGTPARPKNSRSDDGRNNRDGDQQRSDNRSPWNGGGGSPWSGQPGGEAAMAQSYFSRLDQNQDGRIDPTEWEQSRRVRGLFEQAGIRLDSMDLATFTKNLQRATAGAGQQQGGR